MKVFTKIALPALLAFVMLFTCCACTPDSPKTGAATSASEYATKVGIDVLKQGGNAFDAIVAMAFTIGVVEPNASGIGGGGVMVGYDAANNDFVFYNFREFAPAAATAEALGTEAALHEGKKAMGVPTEVLGLLKIHEDLGSKNLTRADVIQPAVDYAENGIEVNGTFKTNISDAYFDMDEEGQELYGDGTGLGTLEVGDVYKNPNYAKVLKLVQEKGVEGFYKGEVAEAIVAACDLLTQADLDYAVANYPKVSDPIHGTYNGYDVYTSNIPSTGGIVLLETLNMLEDYCTKNNKSLKDYGVNTADYIHLVGTATQLSFADKRHYVADNAVNPNTSKPFANVPVEGLISKQYASERFKVFNPNDTFRRGMNEDYGAACGVDPWDYDSNKASATAYSVTVDIKDEGTTSFSAMDKDGNVATITQTINTYWGCRVMPVGTGFFLNNQLADFSFDANSVNLIEPYKQPLSSMAPTIVLKDGKVVATLGCPGSTTIPTAIIQTLLNLLDFDMDIKDAIETPRFQSECVSESDATFMPDGEDITTLKYIGMEKGDWATAVKAALEGKNYFVYDSMEMVTHVYGINCRYDSEGNRTVINAWADSRRAGVGTSY